MVDTLSFISQIPDELNKTICRRLLTRE